MTRSFIKMHGAGNDFVIFDARTERLALTPSQIMHIADRRYGVGCDQIVVIGVRDQVTDKNFSSATCHLPLPTFMTLYNADGSETSACGNATRCVAWLLMEETGAYEVMLHTKAGTLRAERAGDLLVRVDMGEPVFNWKKIPLAKECKVDEINLSSAHCPLPTAHCLSMGNPHLIFAVDNVDLIDIEKIGTELEHHPLFPERVNVSFAQILSPQKIKLRVWERGAGATLACGTAACATLVALHKKGLVSRKADIQLPGGTLTIEWDEASNHVFMTGTVAESFRGEINV